MENVEIESMVLLEELCTKYSAASEEVTALQDNLLNPLLKSLMEEGNTVSVSARRKALSYVNLTVQ